MIISLRTVFWAGFFCVGGALAACSRHVTVGESGMAGAGGEGDSAGGSAKPGGGASAGTTSAGTASGSGPTTGGTAGTGVGGSAQAGNEGGSSAQAGTGGGDYSEAGTAARTPAEAGTGGRDDDSEAGTGGGGSAEAGAGGAGPSATSPYAPRSGPFEMLVYWGTNGYEHVSSEAGQEMLTAIAAEQDFDLTITDTNEDITLEGLSRYEIVFFLNTSGDVFNDTEQQAFEEWMTTRHGAFAGTHSATETEAQWSFYKEMTGQFHDGHSNFTPREILIQDAAIGFPGMNDLPNPWLRNDEWFKFNEHEVWSAKQGFKILARNAADNHPVSWTREFANFRCFYTSMGHDSMAFGDEMVKTHVAGGIMWTVRREHRFRQ